MIIYTLKLERNSIKTAELYNILKTPKNVLKYEIEIRYTTVYLFIVEFSFLLDAVFV